MSKPKQAREKATGRYGYEGRWERLCTCGHPLGVHTAATPHECIVETGCDTNCMRFRPAKRKAK